MLRPRGMGIMDFIAKTGADLVTPPQASPVVQNQSYLSRSMGRPEVQFSQPSASTMATSYPSGMVAMASPTPQVQAMMRGQTPERTATVTPPQVTSARPQVLEPNRMMGPRGAVGSGVMQEGVDREKMIAASKIAEVEAKNPELKADPSFQDRIKGLFGDREKMLGLALAFNSMRLRPDTGLATIIGSELKDIRETRKANKTVPAIISFLRSKGYEEYAKVVESNPSLASDIYTQVIQKELKPTGKSEVTAPQLDAQGNYFVNVEQPDGSFETKFLTDPTTGQQLKGTTPADRATAEVEAKKVEAQFNTSMGFSKEAFDQAKSLGSKIRLYEQALVEIERGADTGPIASRLLPTIREATANLESIKNQLGITVINAATFGALSESELRLALDTELPLGLNEDELAVYLRRKIDAQSKLQQEMLKKAYDMASKPYDQYLKEERDRVMENSKYLQAPEGVSVEMWSNMNLDEKKEFMALGDQ